MMIMFVFSYYVILVTFDERFALHCIEQELETEIRPIPKMIDNAGTPNVSISNKFFPRQRYLCQLFQSFGIAKLNQ